MIAAVDESKVAQLTTSATAYGIQFPQRGMQKNGLRVVRGRSKLTLSDLRRRSYRLKKICFPSERS